METECEIVIYAILLSEDDPLAGHLRIRSSVAIPVNDELVAEVLGGLFVKKRAPT